MQKRFEAEHGCKVEGTFGAVGMMRDKLLAGEPCDLLILTGELVSSWRRRARSSPAARARWAWSKPASPSRPARPFRMWARPRRWKRCCAARAASISPIPQKATAGIHFMKVLRMLGLEQDVAAARCGPSPMARRRCARWRRLPATALVGCTQVTEILYTPGVQLAGMLPKKFELQTMYTAAVCSRCHRTAACGDAGRTARRQRSEGRARRQAASSRFRPAARSPA